MQIAAHGGVIIKKSSIIFIVNFIKEEIKIKCFIMYSFFNLRVGAKNEQKLCI